MKIHFHQLELRIDQLHDTATEELYMPGDRQEEYGDEYPRCDQSILRPTHMDETPANR